MADAGQWLTVLELCVFVDCDGEKYIFLIIISVSAGRVVPAFLYLPGCT